jgi:histidinol dehydrogenase
LKIIEGFEKTRVVLSRETTVGSFAASPALKRRLKELFDTESPEEAVSRIIDDVRTGGDKALIDLTLKIDGIKLKTLEITKKDIASAYKLVDDDLVKALKIAAERVRDFHAAQKKSMCHEFSRDGVGQLIRPLERVGLYVPGGTAVYPSTVLMTAIPAKVAGVSEIIMVSPPKSSGSISEVTLVAADIARVDRVFCVGGAQAVAALAFGTASIPKVDKICGPGNIFVTLAKKQVFGKVDIDGLQGPSEVLIIADDKSDPAYCAAELLAQAEHDASATSVLLTTSRKIADEVNRRLEKQQKTLSRLAIIGQSLDRGVIAVIASLDEAVELSNLYAPEHLCLLIENSAGIIPKITNAGCIVAGRQATVALGDYIAGPSHALPTSGTARFGSPLNIFDFIKFISVIDTEKLDIKQLNKTASLIARAEGLDAHARALEMRLRD